MADAALVLAILLAAAHSYLGERYLLIRLFRREDLPKLLGSTEFTTRTLRFAWHLTSIAWIGLAAAVVAPGRVAEIAGATFAASGLAALVGSRGRHLAWIVFFGIAALAWAAR
jgi:hypothetical protein